MEGPQEDIEGGELFDILMQSHRSPSLCAVDAIEIGNILYCGFKWRDAAVRGSKRMCWVTNVWA